MGANIGTSVTNTLASLPQISRSSEFSRAFSAATVHDFFNMLAVLVLFPVQVMTNFLGSTATLMGKAFQHVGGLTFLNPVKALTKPMVHLLIKGVGIHPWILLILSLLLLLFALKGMVSTLKAIVVRKAEMWFDTILFKTAIRSFLVGLLLTVMVQSSSITTSLMVPMAGAGILALEKIFPYTLGANVGTIIVAFSHLIFNVAGMVIWWPLQCVPIFLARKFSQYSIRNKMIPVGYILIMFFIVPLLGIYFLK
jgi:sodium-dependent phosphate cotransporter